MKKINLFINKKIPYRNDLVNLITTNYAINNNFNLIRLNNIPSPQNTMCISDFYIKNKANIAQLFMKNIMNQKLINSIKNEYSYKNFTEILINFTTPVNYVPFLNDIRQSLKSPTYLICPVDFHCPEGIMPIINLSNILPVKEEILLFKGQNNTTEICIYLPIKCVKYPLPNIKNNAKCVPLSQAYALKREKKFFYNKDLLSSYVVVREGEETFYYSFDTVHSLVEKVKYFYGIGVKYIFMNFDELDELCKINDCTIEIFLEKIK